MRISALHEKASKTQPNTNYLCLYFSVNAVKFISLIVREFVSYTLTGNSNIMFIFRVRSVKSDDDSINASPCHERHVSQNSTPLSDRVEGNAAERPASDIHGKPGFDT